MRAQLRGLVREDHDVGALGQLAVARDGLPARLRGELLRPARAGVGAQHGLPPAEGERARHVAAADEADLHRRQSTTG